MIDTYLIAWLVLRRDAASLGLAGALSVVLAGLWFVMPQLAKRAMKRSGDRPE